MFATPDLEFAVSVDMKKKKPDIDRPGTKSSLCLSVLYPRVWLFLPLGSQQEFLKLANHISNSETEKHSKKCPFRPQLFKAPRCTVINKIFFDFSSFTFVQCAHGLSQADGLERIYIFLLHSLHWFLGRNIPAEFCIKETFCWVLWVQIQSGHADHHIVHRLQPVYFIGGINTPTHFFPPTHTHSWVLTLRGCGGTV